MNTAADRPRILFANRVYWPDEQATAQLLTDLAEGLAARGWPVTVLTGGNRGLPNRERRNGVDVVRVGGRQGRRPHLAAKAVAYATFTMALRTALRRTLRRGDVLVAMTDPPSLAPVASAAARRAGARLVHWLQDVHPEVGLALRPGRLRTAAWAPWRRWRDAAWQAAEACVVLGDDMARFVATRAVAAPRIRVLPNWAPGASLPRAVPSEDSLRRAWELDDRFVVMYSGNLGRVHALDPLLAAAACLRTEADVVFLFCGDGPRQPALESAAHVQGLANVRFRPPQPRDRLAETLSIGDVHLVTLRSGCERFVYPSKLYGVLAVGRPIVFVGPPHCDLAEEVLRRGAGLVAADDAPEEAAAAIRTLHDDPALRASMGRKAAEWFRATGGLPAAIAGWEKLLRGE
jgi:putative colanic acid biosynthesis glycosyltransferase WcaI